MRSENYFYNEEWISLEKYLIFIRLKLKFQTFKCYSINQGFYKYYQKWAMAQKNFYWANFPSVLSQCEQIFFREQLTHFKKILIKSMV